MRPIDDLSYYELFGVAPNASLSEIKHAYSKAMAIYGDDSLVTYSLFSDDQRDQLLSRIEKAFTTLTDIDRRRTYDRQLIDEGRIPSEAIRPSRPDRVKPLFNSRRAAPPTVTTTPLNRSQNPDVQASIDRLSAQTKISGEDLRLIREQMDITHDDIYMLTRISRASLKALEEDDAGHLPSPIYVRNFIKGYAKALGLDQDQTATAYLAHLGMD